jgi:uncharacterized protein YxeA
MKKIIIALSVFALLAITGAVLAQGGQQVQQQNRIQDPTTHSDTVTPQGNQVQNQNQIQVQNQGEETQLRTATQHMEQLMDMQGLNEGIGVQVRQLVQEQVQAQNQIQTQLEKLESRSGFMKRLFGTDYGAIKNLKQQMEQNQLRIQQLTQLQNEVANQAEENQLQEAVQALIDQNIALQEKIQSEEKVGGILAG